MKSPALLLVICLSTLSVSWGFLLNQGCGDPWLRQTGSSRLCLASTEAPIEPPLPKTYGDVAQKAFDSLSDVEKYNSLAQGLLRKIIQVRAERQQGGEGAPALQFLRESLQEGGDLGGYETAWDVVKEMTRKGIRLTPRSLSLLVDAASISRSARVLSQSLGLAEANGVLQAFNTTCKGLERAAVQKPKVDLPFRLPLPTGRRREGDQNGESKLPEDDRKGEVLSALGFLGYTGGWVGDEIVGPLVDTDWTFFDQALPGVALAGLGAAALYDFLQGGQKVGRQVAAGLKRLFLQDVKRESLVEAASFLTAYLDGVPAFPFRPTSQDALRVWALSTEEGKSTAGGRRAPEVNGSVDSLLVWLMAPVVAESDAHEDLIYSDPRIPRKFLQAVDEIEKGGGVEVDKGEIEKRLRAAFDKASALLSKYRSLHLLLAERMESEISTVGDCVAFVENFFRQADESKSSPEKEKTLKSEGSERKQILWQKQW